MTVKSANKINLIEIANQLALTAKGLQKKVDDTGIPVMVTANLLAGKIPDLKVLGNTTIFRLRKTEDGYKADTPCIYVNDEGVAGIYNPEYGLLNDFEVLDYKSGITGYANIKHKSGLELQISISYNDEHLIELEGQNVDGIEGKGVPSSSYLKLVPQPETPLHSDLLPHNVELTIVSNGKFSRKFETPLVNVKTDDGKQFKDVLCNAALHRIYESHGEGAKFKIMGKRPKRNREGLPIDAQGKVNNTNHAWIVEILDCQGADFSDL